MNLVSQISFQSISNQFQTQVEQFSPISRKTIFSRTKKINSPQPPAFNPHLEKLKINYYKKQNQIIPYSYTIAENQKSQQKISNNQKKYLRLTKSNSIASKIKSLKQFSCIETVSQKSGNQNQQSQHSHLQITTNFKPHEQDLMELSHYDFENKQRSYTLAQSNDYDRKANLNRSSHNPKNKKVKQIQDRTLNLTRHERQNDRKINKLNLNANYNDLNSGTSNQINGASSQSYNKNCNLNHCSLNHCNLNHCNLNHCKTMEIKITPTSFTNLEGNGGNGCEPSTQKEQLNVIQSHIIFDYNQFVNNHINSQKPQISHLNLDNNHLNHHNFSSNLANISNSPINSINKSLFRYFQQQQLKSHPINQNYKGVDAINQINSPQYNVSEKKMLIGKKLKLFNTLHNFSPTQKHLQQNKRKNTFQFCNQQQQDQDQQSLFCSYLTSLVQQGPRSYSGEKSLKKLSGLANNMTQNLKHHSSLSNKSHDKFLANENQKNERSTDKKTTIKSSLLTSFECNTPKIPLSACDNKVVENQNKFNIAKFNFNQPSSPTKFLELQNSQKNGDNKFNKYQNKCFNYNRHQRFMHADISNQKQENNQNQNNSKSKQSNRRSKKGITVSSKQKKTNVKTQVITLNHAGQIQRKQEKISNNQRIFVSSKLKNLTQLKNLKKLRLVTQTNNNPKQQFYSSQT